MIVLVTTRSLFSVFFHSWDIMESWELSIENIGLSFGGVILSTSQSGSDDKQGLAKGRAEQSVRNGNNNHVNMNVNFH